MFTIMLMILIILLPSIYISLKKEIEIEKVIPCTVFSITLILYLFGLINLLKFGSYAIYILFILFIILMILEFKRKQINIKKLFFIILKPSILIWVLVIIIFYFYYKGRMLIAWDEFSHWGDVVKMMYNKNVFNTNPNSLSIANSYPPIMSIFQYFVENLSIYGFKEHYLFCAYQTFVISLFLPFIRKIKWKEIIKLFLVLIILSLVPTIFFSTPYYYYNIIYIDPFLGILFGYLVAYIFILKKYEKIDVINISLALFALTLTKDIAPVFSIIVLGIVFLDFVFVDKNYKKLKKINKENIRAFFKDTKPVWIFLFVIMVSYISWKINVLINVKHANSSNLSNIKDIIKELFGITRTYRSVVINNYFDKLSSYKITPFSNVYVISSILILFSILIYNNEKNSNKTRSSLVFTLMFIGEIFYIMLMLILYLLMFTEYEAISLASFERYLGSYLTAILSFLALISIYRCIEQKKFKNLIILLIILIINSNFSIILSSIYNNNSNKIEIQNFRKNFSEAAKGVKNKIDNNKKYKFYIIIQNSSGFDKWILRYEFRDIMKEMNEGFNWSLGQKYDEDDIWTLDITKEEFKNILYDENYDYVYLYNIDDQFISTYSSIFSSENIEDEQLYKVDKKNDKLELIK